MMMRLAVGGVVAVALAAAVWIATGAGSAESAGFLPYEDRQTVEAGAEIYAEHCASCHGADLEGEGDWRSPGPDGLMPAPPHDDTGHTWHHPDALLFAITKHGSEAVVGGGYQSNMEGFGDVLSDDGIVAVLAYIKSTWPPRVVDTHNRINAEAVQDRP